MPLLLPTEIERLVQKHLATGRYSTTEEVLITALERLQDEEDILADLQAAMEDEDAGRVRDIDEVDAELRERFRLPRTQTN